jgi:3-hydroxyacyl-CoA dehydrogenase
MGADIAILLANAGLEVLVIEKDEASASTARNRLLQFYDRQVLEGRLAPEKATDLSSRLTVTHDWNKLFQQDLVIEAAYEDISVKVDIFRRLDSVVRADAILATNTSYLDIDVIAAATSRPHDVIGLHFFSPANIMKLLEIVLGSKTEASVVATALALAKRIGKTPVVAKNCDGFIGNRIYAQYRRHAEYLIEDGANPEEIDAALEAYGFAMGVFAVSDASGLDISWAMRKRREETRDPNERYVSIADSLCEAGRLGRKTGAGWYAYDKQNKKSVDPVVTALITSARAQKEISPRSFSQEAIQRRLLSVMVNEGAKLLMEGIAQRASDIDLTFTSGYGFPRIKGGPMWAADRLGLNDILKEMEFAHMAGGAGSEPAPLLIELVRNGGTLADWRIEPGIQPGEAL